MTTKSLLLTIMAVGLIGLIAGLWVVAIRLHRQRMANQPAKTIEQPSPAAAKANVYPSPQSSSTPNVPPKQLAMSRMKMDYKWSKGGFDNIMLVDFEFQNPTQHSVKDLTITCTHFGPSGTEIDSNTRTIYEIIPGQGRKRINDFNMGFIHTQARSTRCEIVDLEL